MISEQSISPHTFWHFLLSSVSTSWAVSQPRPHCFHCPLVCKQLRNSAKDCNNQACRDCRAQKTGCWAGPVARAKRPHKIEEKACEVSFERLCHSLWLDERARDTQLADVICSKSVQTNAHDLCGMAQCRTPLIARDTSSMRLPIAIGNHQTSTCAPTLPCREGTEHCQKTAAGSKLPSAGNKL